MAKQKNQELHEDVPTTHEVAEVVSTTEEVVEPEIVDDADQPMEKLVVIPESEWIGLLNRVSALETEFERFKRQYKMIHGTVQEINYRFSQTMAESEAKK